MQRAGAEGEQRASGELARTLGDDWVLLRGYRNRRGEIDHLLIGPGGVTAIETKNRNATITCHQGRWDYVKYDNYGNPVERGEITDAQRSQLEQLIVSDHQRHNARRPR
jgi:hypothetical protein